MLNIALFPALLPALFSAPAPLALTPPAPYHVGQLRSGSAAEQRPTLLPPAHRDAPSSLNTRPLLRTPDDATPSATTQEPIGVVDPRDCFTCLPGYLLEGEAHCSDGYEDSFNDGCFSSPNAFTDIACGQTVCGTYGTFYDGVAPMRDNDWYRFTIPEASTVTWTATGEAATLVYLFDGSCPVLFPHATGTAGPCQPATAAATLDAGTYYAWVSTELDESVPCGSRYRATLSASACCTGVTPQAGDIPEGEPVCTDEYADPFNGGCNSAPHIFSEIACGQSVTATYGTYLFSGANFRDTDWYRFTLTEPAMVTWAATGEARTLVLLLNGTCPAGDALAAATADPCQAAAAAAMLAPGTYYAWVSTDAFSGVPCGSRYRATLTASTCCDGALPQPGDALENEPLCADEYTDFTNGGCGVTPHVFTEIFCGQPVAGTYGTFVSAGSNARDADWYRFTLTGPSMVAWTATGEARTRVALFDGVCPVGPALATAVADPCQPATAAAMLAPGTYYARVTTSLFTGVPCGSRYRATLTTSTCCPGIVTQPGDIPEGEPVCADDSIDTFNGGCYLGPSFTEISCGQTFAGTYGTYLENFPFPGREVRDHDWYRFTLNQTSTVTWRATGEARTLVLLFNGICPPGDEIALATADPCQPATTTATLAPGTYFAWVGTDALSGVPCGSRYRATLTTSTCCPADWNDDTAVNSNDISAFLTDWLSSITLGHDTADFNGDLTVNSNDISAFLTAWLQNLQNGC